MIRRLSGVMRSRPAAAPAEPISVEGAAKRSIELAYHRTVIGGILFALAFLVVGLRLADVTLLKEPHEPRVARAADSLGLERGRADIVDRNGVLLATSLATGSLYANPRQLLDPRDAAARLAKALPFLDQVELARKLQSERSFVWVARNLTPRQQDQVNRLGLPGLFFQREDRRVYPNGFTAAHVLGFANIDSRGLAGIEQAFDDRLRRNPEALQLSIDTRIQHLMREELTAAIEEFKGIGGAGLVLDAHTGEILALVSLPDFDVNQPGLASEDARFNRVTLGTYEPGSIFKIFNTAMALDGGVTTMRGGYDASKPIKISRFTISDFKGQNRFLTVPEIFMYSSNIGSARMALDAGIQRQRDFLGRLGMLTPAQIELPEVAAPMIPRPWREINTMTVAFGHGISVTPLQLAVGVSAIVNGGYLRPATLIKRTEGNPTPGQRVIQAKTSDQLRLLLRLVVDKGTGKAANVPGYWVGGKTGTAEKNVNGVYKKNARISSFISAFPITNPRFVVYAMIDEPKPTKSTYGYATGGWVAAPMVGRVIERLAATMGMEPHLQPPAELQDPILIQVGGRG